MAKITANDQAENLGQKLLIVGETTSLEAKRYKANKDRSNHIARGDTFRFSSGEYSNLVVKSYDLGL